MMKYWCVTWNHIHSTSHSTFKIMRIPQLHWQEIGYFQLYGPGAEARMNSMSELGEHLRQLGLILGGQLKDCKKWRRCLSHWMDQVAPWEWSWSVCRDDANICKMCTHRCVYLCSVDSPIVLGAIGIQVVNSIWAYRNKARESAKPNSLIFAWMWLKLVNFPIDWIIFCDLDGRMRLIGTSVVFGVFRRAYLIFLVHGVKESPLYQIFKFQYI
jgi:hypothetical protein